MTKERLIILLKEYKENKAILKLRYKERDNYKKILEQNIEEGSTTTNIGINCDIHSKNLISNKVEKQVIKIIEIQENAKKRINELNNEISELKDKIQEVRIRLEAITEKEKEILSAYYIEKLSYMEIGDQIYFKLYKQTRNAKTIKKIIENVTERISKL